MTAQEQEKLIDAARKFLAIVDDPQLGLIAWHEATNNTAKALAVAAFVPYLLPAILDYITGTAFDYWHGCGPQADWSIPAVPLMDKLVELTGMTKEEMGRLFDEARHRVHGAKAE